MPKSKILCAHCDAKMASGTSFCPNCKQPTMFASVEERTSWELRQWEIKRGAPRKRATPARATAEPVKPKREAGTVKPAPLKVLPMKAAPKRAPAARPSAPEPVSRAAAQPDGQKKPEAAKKPIVARKPKAPKKLELPKKAAAPAKPRVSTKSKNEPLVIDLRGVDAPRDLQLEQVELLRELLERVTSIEEKLNGNGTRARRLRLLKR